MPRRISLYPHLSEPQLHERYRRTPDPVERSRWRFHWWPQRLKKRQGPTGPRRTERDTLPRKRRPMPLPPLVPSQRPLLIWAVLALACGVVLSVEGVSFLSGRTRSWPGWRFGVLFLLGSLVAAALSARLYDLHGEFQWTEADLATWLILGTLLGSAVLAFTVYGA